MAAPTPSAPSAATYGIGARIALHPMTDRYVDIITTALAATPRPPELELTTSPVSTFVGGPDAAVVRYCADLVAAAAHRADGAHLAAQVLLSRGCPGEVTCTLRHGPWVDGEAVAVPDAGVRAWAEWSLYPLLDGQGGGAHMTPIMDAIATARASGLFHSSDHFVTRLAGDVGAILALVATAWLRTGADVQHVVTHLSLSINSPTQGV